MSRRGQCGDNAVAESFFSSLKKERIRKRAYKTRDSARADVFDYIEVFYNPTRRHSHLGGFGPEAFERASIFRLVSVLIYRAVQMSVVALCHKPCCGRIGSDSHAALRCMLLPHSRNRPTAVNVRRWNLNTASSKRSAGQECEITIKEHLNRLRKRLDLPLVSNRRLTRLLHIDADECAADSE